MKDRVSWPSTGQGRNSLHASTSIHVGGDTINLYQLTTRTNIKAGITIQLTRSEPLTGSPFPRPSTCTRAKIQYPCISQHLQPLDAFLFRTLRELKLPFDYFVQCIAHPGAGFGNGEGHKDVFALYARWVKSEWGGRGGEIDQNRDIPIIKALLPLRLEAREQRLERQKHCIGERDF